MRCAVAIMVLALAGCQPVDPMDDEAARELRAGADYFAQVRASGIDPKAGRVFDEGGRTPFVFGEWTVRCATVRVDPDAPDPARPPKQRVLLIGDNAHVETRLTGRWFDHLWRKGRC